MNNVQEMNSIVDNETNDIVNLPLKLIHEDNDFNCRGKVAPIDVADLIESIRQYGLQQPLLVRKYSEDRKAKTGFPYGLIAGYRRFKALKCLNKQETLCKVRENISDNEARIINLQENLIRQDLNILQEAKAIEKLYISGFKYEEIAQQLHKSMGWVQMRIRVLKFPEDVQEECAKGVINQGQIAALATLPKDKLYEQVRNIKKKRLSGEKGLVIKRPTTQESKRGRNRQEMNSMLDHIYENLGPSFATRVLAWCCGNISSFDLFKDIKKQMDDKGLDYTIPEEEL